MLSRSINAERGVARASGEGRGGEALTRPARDDQQGATATAATRHKGGKERGGDGPLPRRMKMTERRQDVQRRQQEAFREDLAKVRG